MDRADKQHGLQPVLVWTSQHDMVFWRDHLKALRHPPPLGEFYLDRNSPAADCPTTAGPLHGARTDSYGEQNFLNVADFAELLDVRWNSPDLNPPLSRQGRP